MRSFSEHANLLAASSDLDYQVKEVFCRPNVVRYGQGEQAPDPARKFLNVAAVMLPGGR